MERFNNPPLFGGSMSEPKYRRLTPKQKRAIIEMHGSGNWKGAELALMFKVSPSRISQLVCDYYGEKKALGVEDAQQD